MIKDALQTRAPDLVAVVRLYPIEDGGKDHPALPGYGCPCFAAPDLQQVAWDARLLLEEPFEPGTERQVGFVFLSSQGAETMRDAGQFYLWDGRFVGEARVVG